MPRAFSFCINRSRRASSSQSTSRQIIQNALFAQFFTRLSRMASVVAISALYQPMISVRRARKSPLLVKIPTRRTHRVIAQSPRAFIELPVVGGQHAAFAGGNDLVAIETEDAAFAETADLAALVFGAVRLSRIFDDIQTVFVTDGNQGVHIGGM